MSHVRNLLHPAPREVHVPPATNGAAHTDDILSFSNIAVAPVLAAVAAEFQVEEAHLSVEDRIVYHDSPRSPAADRFRLLRMRLKERAASGKLKKILITGPLAHEGKSTVILNLATALAEHGKRSVLVVEADLHNSSLIERLGLKPWTGLTDCLSDPALPPLSVIRRIEPLKWCLLPAGQPCTNPTELLQGPALGELLQQVSPSFDWVLIDSPPVIPLTDSLSLVQYADASLVVVRAGKTSRDTVEQTIALLGKKNVLGIVLNGVEARDHLYYQYYEGYGRNRDA